MASASYTIKEFDGTTDVVFSLVGNTNVGAEYRNATRALSLPQSMEFAIQIGAPSAKGNDHLKMTIKDTRLNSTTGLVSTGSVTVDVSVPRDADAWTDTDSKDLLAFVRNMFTDARIVSLIDGLVP